MQATGVVRKFVRADVEKEIGEIRTTPFDECEGKPALVIRGRIGHAPPQTRGARAPPARRSAAGAAGTTGAMADPIPDILIIVTAPDRPPGGGRRVQRRSAATAERAGNKTFWVGPSEKQRLFVVLGEERTAGTATEGKVDVERGQTVTLTGVVRKLPGMEAARKRGPSAQQADGLYERGDLPGGRARPGREGLDARDEERNEEGQEA